MTENELRVKYTQAIRIVRAERHMVEHLFANDPVTKGIKLVELAMLESIITEFKDELKAHVDAEQPRLLDVPRKAGYE